MANFLLTATDRSGNRETVRVEAENSQDAWRQLELQGYRDIALHTSDVEAAILPTALDPGKVTPADLMQLRMLSHTGFFLFLLKRLYAQAWWMVAIGALALAIHWWNSERLGLLGILAIVIIGMPLVIAITTTLFGKSFKHSKLVEAQAWGRWQEVLKLAPPFRSGSTAFDTAAREACALAGLGRLDEGLRLLEERRFAVETPRWMYLRRTAEVYDVAKMYDKGLACHRLAYEDAPENAAVQVALAMALLKNETDIPLAKELIDAAESQHLSDLLLAILPHIKGLYALNTGNSAEAKQCFRAAHEALQAFAATSPAIGVVIDVNRANLAIAHAKLHELRDAEQQYKLARPRLVALQSTRLLDRVERALGTR